MKTPEPINELRKYVEPGAFGVCSWLGEKMSVPRNHIRLWFIYAAFIANFSPVIVYMILAFWLNLRDLILTRRSRIWE